MTRYGSLRYADRLSVLRTPGPSSYHPINSPLIVTDRLAGLGSDGRLPQEISKYISHSSIVVNVSTSRFFVSVKQFTPFMRKYTRQTRLDIPLERLF